MGGGGFAALESGRFAPLESGRWRGLGKRAAAQPLESGGCAALEHGCGARRGVMRVNENASSSLRVQPDEPE